MKLLYIAFTGILMIIMTACNASAEAVDQQMNSSPINPTSVSTLADAQSYKPSQSIETTQGPLLSTSQTEASPNTAEINLPTTLTAFPPTIVHTPRPTFNVSDWQELPIIPEVSDKVIRIYETGLALGNDPKKFSKIGDCGSTPAWFLGDFDRGPEYYDLGQYSSLSGVINEFSGSFERTSLAARSGFNASALFSPLWSDWDYCQANESPIACEYRVHKPMIAFIMLGTNDIWKPEEFEPQMRKILEFSIESGVIPIISTKADNAEGDHSINSTIALLAWEYEVPLLNYWLAVQPLPDQGLQEDDAHLTWGRNFFDDPNAMSKAWPVRNLTALQALDAVWQKIQSQQ